MSLPSHGSNPAYLYDYYNLNKPNQVIDFSVNTNPLGMPNELVNNWSNLLEKVADYPDPHNTNLLERLSNKLQINQSHLLLGNGAAELISLIAFYLRKKSVLMIQPTFSEYEQMCKVHDCEISYFTVLPEESINLKKFETAVKTQDAVFFCNPNNPTGKYVKKDQLEKMARICLKYNCLLIVDEAFYDFLIDYDDSIDLHKKYSNLIFLRSLTKIYAIAGLRLGYLVTQPSLILKLEKYLSHWHINAIADAAGQICLKENQFVRDTQTFILKEREYMAKALKELAFEVIPSSVNYYLIRDDLTTNLQPLFVYLLKKGLVLRHTVNFPGLDGKWLRIAVKTKQENKVLLEALKQWRKET